jgi:hypothetical protein
MRKPWDFEQPLCSEAGIAGADIWFLDSGFGKSEPQIQIVKKVCNSCIEKRDCFQYALHNKVRGIWGGTTFSERERIRKQRNIKAAEIVLHFNAAKYKETA